MDDSSSKDQQSGLYSGLFGWRKRCLYAILMVLLVLITINVTLVIWIVRVLKINHYGVAGLQAVVSGVQLTGHALVLDTLYGVAGLQAVVSGVQLTGHALVLDTLVSSKLLTPHGQTLSLQSSTNATLSSGHTRPPPSTIYLGEEGLDLNTPSFQVRDLRGKTLFSVDKDSVSLTAATLHISGEGGAVLDGSLQTPIVSAQIRSDLTLESATKAVQAVTATGVTVESRAGDIRALSHQDVTLITVDGSIKFESANVFVPTLKSPKTSRQPRQPRRHHHHHQPERIYQLCACTDGELFLGEAESYCDPSLCL